MPIVINLELLFILTPINTWLKIKWVFLGIYFTPKSVDLLATLGSHLVKVKLATKHGENVGGKHVMAVQDIKVQERPNCNAIVAGGRNPIGRTYFAWGSLCKVHGLDDAFLIYPPVEYLYTKPIASIIFGF